MELEELKNYLEIDLEGSLAERFMGSADMYVRFLKKFAGDNGYAALLQAMESGDDQNVLRCAHNLKGVCATLGLAGLQRSFADIVSLIRSGSYSGELLRQKTDAAGRELERTKELLLQLK